MAQAAAHHSANERELWIAGHVFGDVDAPEVTVAHDAVVDGTIGADTVVIYGRVNGTINAHSITLGRSAVVEGELTYDTMSVAPGAVIGAHCTAS